MFHQCGVWWCVVGETQGKAQRNGEEGKADRERGVKTTSGNGQARSSPSPRGQWGKEKNGGNWLRNHLWCPNDPRGKGIDEMVRGGRD